MESSARRVKAERDRNRLPKRRAAARWTRRIAGIVATGALIGVGYVSYDMIRPDGGDAVVAATPTPTATPKAKKPSRKHKPATKHKGLTKAQKAARADAVATLREQGFTTLKESDYDPKATLRVLIGRPVGDAGGGHTAFFFTRDGLVGKDAQSPSTELKVAKQGKATITLTYGVYRAGDPAGQPSSSKKVRFRLVDGALAPQDTVPTAEERFIRSSG
jgi:hypothetical protein